MRQWLDHGVQPWRTWLAGVEGHEPYRNPCWELYDRLEVGAIQEADFLSLLPAGAERWDCILMSDVLEHFDAKEGLRQLRRAKAALGVGGLLVVSTPGQLGHQGQVEHVHGNTLERHRSVWHAADLEPLGFRMVRREGRKQDGSDTVIAVWRRRPERPRGSSQEGARTVTSAHAVRSHRHPDRSRRKDPP